MLRSIKTFAGDDPKASLALIRRLVIEFGVSQWKRYTLAFVLMGVSAACTAFPAYLITDLVNRTYIDRDLSFMLWLGGAIGAIFTLRGFATYGQLVIMSRIANHTIAENQRRLFDKLLNENIAFFADHHSTEFAQRLVTGSAAATQVLNLIVTSVGRDLFSLIALIGVMVMRAPTLSLISFVVVPPAMLALRKMIKRVRGIAMSQFTGGARVLETLQETLQGIRVIKAFTLEDTMRERFRANVGVVERESNNMARVANRTSPLMETLGGLAVMAIIMYGGSRIIENPEEAGLMFSFIMAFLLAYEPAKRLARFNLDLTGSLVPVRILFDTIDSAPAEPPDDDRPRLAVTNARVELAHVEFAYRPGEPVLRDLSFTAEPAQVTALVGHSGGGKSTILGLIPRFYEVGGGAITIDGQDIAAVSRHSLRAQIAHVGQDVFLFRGTVRDNIALGRPGASEHDILEAAKAAHAHDFITAFPAGYDTQVGERGLQLSGGERQRIAIARALVKNAPIILLDEATAALDSESEHHVQEAIARLCAGRTTIVIAHRLTTIMHADRILVIETGQLVEAGRHDDLLRKGGRYAAFYRLQLKRQSVGEQREPAASLA